MKFRSRGLIAAVALAVPMSLAACGSSDTASGDSSSPSPSSSSSSTTTTAAAAGMNFGPGCAKVPTEGKGSFQGMATDPVATAASNNPLLKTLVGAVGAAGLGQTLNSTPDITVFAPVDSAFAQLPPAALKAALADPKGMLTKILTNHVVAGKLTPEQLPGEHETLNKTMINVTGSGADFTVDGAAKVICGNVQTANAVVYIIDGVLVPKAA